MKNDTMVATGRNRRQALRGAGALALSTIAVPGLPRLVYAGRELPTEMPSGRVSTTVDYVGVSSALVGVEQNVLDPTNMQQDDVSLALMYFTISSQASPADTQNLIYIYTRLVDQGLTAQQVADELLKQNDGQPRHDAIGAMARLCMMMWLYGSWFGGTEVANMGANYANLSGDYLNDFVVSARAYKNAWIWRIAQAHPMGFSHFNFGSWGDVPPSLADYRIFAS